MTVRIRTHVDSELVRLPELRPFIGKDVEILVSETPPSMLGGLPDLSGVKPFDFDAMKGGWPGSAQDGFEEAVDEWRKKDVPPELPE